MPNDPIKEALQMMPYGFYSITSRHNDEVNAMVANWITQVSFEPRLVMLALQKTAYSHDLVLQGKVFAVNLFRHTDADIIKMFSKSRAKNPDKMANAHYKPAPETGCPILEGSVAYIECKVAAVFDIKGDHDLVVGEVVGAGVTDALEPENILSLPDLGWSYAG